MPSVQSLRDSITMVLLLICVLLSMFASSISATTSSMVEVGAWKDELASLITSRDIESNPILSKAEIIFKSKLSNNTPLQEAAIGLMKSCRSADKTSTSHSNTASAKETAQQIYAIKASLVDLEVAGQVAPSSCPKISHPVQPSWMTFYQSPTPVEENVKLCLNDLYKTDNKWTSYISHLQEANTLCQVPSVDNASLMIMEMLKDFQTVIPSWTELFNQQQQHAADFMHEQIRFASDLADTQLQIATDAELKSNQIKQSMDSFMESTQARTDQLAASLEDALKAAQFEKEARREALASYERGLVAMHQDQKHVFESSFAEAKAISTQGAAHVQDSLDGLVTGLRQVLGGLDEQFNTLSSTLRVGMQDSIQLNVALQDGQRLSLSTLNDSLQRQHEVDAFFSQLEGRTADLVSVVSPLVEKIGPGLQILRSFFDGRAIRILALLVCWITASFIAFLLVSVKASLIITLLGVMVASLALSMPLLRDLIGVLTTPMTTEAAIALAAYNIFIGSTFGIIGGCLYLCFGPKAFPWNHQWVTGKTSESPSSNGRPNIPRIIATERPIDIEKQQGQEDRQSRNMRSATAEPEMLRPGASRHFRRN